MRARVLGHRRLSERLALRYGSLPWELLLIAFLILDMATGRAVLAGILGVLVGRRLVIANPQRLRELRLDNERLRRERDGYRENV